MAFTFDVTKRGPDMPTSIMRSEIEVNTKDRQLAESIMQQKTEGSANDIVLNKLIQILSYIRSGDRQKLEKKRKGINGERDSKSSRHGPTPTPSTTSDRSSHK